MNTFHPWAVALGKSGLPSPLKLNVTLEELKLWATLLKFNIIEGASVNTEALLTFTKEFKESITSYGRIEFN